MTHTLLVWLEIPESSSAYVIPTDKLTDEERAALELANNHYINEAKTPKKIEAALELLGARINGPEGSGGAWTDYKTDFPIHLTIEHAYLSGFLL